jgi:hypothetical protein
VGSAAVLLNAAVAHKIAKIDARIKVFDMEFLPQRVVLHLQPPYQKDYLLSVPGRPKWFQKGTCPKG